MTTRFPWIKPWKSTILHEICVHVPIMLSSTRLQLLRRWILSNSFNFCQHKQSTSNYISSRQYRNCLNINLVDCLKRNKIENFIVTDQFSKLYFNILMKWFQLVRESFKVLCYHNLYTFILHLLWLNVSVRRIVLLYNYWWK